MVPGGRADLRGAGGDLSSPGGSGGGADALGRVFVVFNPASGRGRGARLIPRYRALLDTHLPGYGHGVTGRAGEEAELADRAVAEGYDTVLAMGGDGTLSHVADRLAASERTVRFGVLPAGTGNDFGRNLGLDHRSPDAVVRALASGRTRRVDMGRVTTPSRPDARPGSPPGPRHFLNVVGVGFDVAVIDAAAGARFLRGEVLYKVTALQQLFRFPGFESVLSESGGMRHGSGAGPGEARATLMLTISNGRYFGGGFPIAPGAAVDDGLLHACRVGDATPLQRAVLFNRAERGRHVDDDRVEITSAAGFRVELDAPPRFEVDGDVHVSTSPALEVEVLPGRLEVVAG